MSSIYGNSFTTFHENPTHAQAVDTRPSPSRVGPGDKTTTEVSLLAGFLAISFERSCFIKIPFIYFHAFVMPKPLVSLTSQIETCRATRRNQRFGFLARFHTISLERSCFNRIACFIYSAM